MIKLKKEDFNIEQIALSGQCFRWNKSADKKYTGVFLGHVCEVEQNGKEITFGGLSDEEFNDFGVEYFDLKRDYKKIKDSYKDDEILKNAIAYGEGVRILNQGEFETLISFIISANNNIPRIKKSIEKICEKYGKRIDFNGNTYFTFPTPEELNRAREDELRACGVGFRDKYIKKACEMITSKNIDLKRIKSLPIEQCRKELLKISGVGPKVADCVMLFSMGKTEAFPVDVWIKRIIEELYLKQEASLKEISEFAECRFGEFAGIAQQYLFNYARNNRL
jgi:N-glycosylase/DNA lyase